MRVGTGVWRGRLEEAQGRVLTDLPTEWVSLYEVQTAESSTPPSKSIRLSAQAARDCRFLLQQRRGRSKRGRSKNHINTCVLHIRVKHESVRILCGIVNDKNKRKFVNDKT